MMIFCTIPQFSCRINPTQPDIVTDYQLNDEELRFIRLIHAFHQRQNDNDLLKIVSQYEEMFDKVNTTRLVVLKVLKYQPDEPTLPIEKSRLQAFHTSPTTTVKTQTTSQEQEIDPMLQFLSGNID